MKKLLTILAILNLAVVVNAQPVILSSTVVNICGPPPEMDCPVVEIVSTHAAGTVLTLEVSRDGGATWTYTGSSAGVSTQAQSTRLTYSILRFTDNVPLLMFRTVEYIAPPPAPVEVAAERTVAEVQGGQRTRAFSLQRGRFYELQESTDGGATWRHKFVTCDWPEPLIQPGVEGIGLCGGDYWFISDTPGSVLRRFVDWSEASPKPGPFYR